MENIFFLILVAIVGLIRWIAQTAENKRNAERQKPRARPAASAPSTPKTLSTEEERVRKFFEALGVPVETAPPPQAPPRRVVTPKTAPADRKFLPVDPFPVPRSRGATTTPAPAPAAPPPLPAATAPATTVAPKAQITVEKKPAMPVPQASEFEVHELDPYASAAAGRPENLIVSRLAAGQGLRDAIILREIFGPPLSLQSFPRTTIG